jgi:hypothetical protein
MRYAARIERVRLATVASIGPVSHDEVDGRIAALVVTRSMATWDERLTAAGAMFAPVRTPPAAGLGALR